MQMPPSFDRTSNTMSKLMSQGPAELKLLTFPPPAQLTQKKQIYMYMCIGYVYSVTRPTATHAPGIVVPTKMLQTSKLVVRQGTRYTSDYWWPWSAAKKNPARGHQGTLVLVSSSSPAPFVACVLYPLVFTRSHLSNIASGL